MISYNAFAVMLASVNMIQKDPVVTKPIAIILGWFLDIVFNVIYQFTQTNALGFTIIAVTIIVRCCMIPLAINQQKSMYIMQKIQPEMLKIQDKYKNSTDPEIKNKMNMEIQKLYAKHKYNPFSGCLPMLIQLPIFIALYYILKNPYQYIEHIKDIYNQLGTVIANSNCWELMQNIAEPHIPGNMYVTEAGYDNPVFHLEDIKNLAKVMNVLSLDEWATIKEAVPNISGLLNTKTEMEYFYGLSLTERVGTSFPNVLIPIFSGLTTFLSSWLISKKNKSSDPMMKTQQNIMNITMPLFMAWITINIPGGVGIYWITSNVFQIFQLLIINNYYDKKMKKEEVKAK